MLYDLLKLKNKKISADHVACQLSLNEDVEQMHMNKKCLTGHDLSLTPVLVVTISSLQS